MCASLMLEYVDANTPAPVVGSQMRVISRFLNTCSTCNRLI